MFSFTNQCIWGMKTMTESLPWNLPTVQCFISLKHISWWLVASVLWSYVFIYLSLATHVSSRYIYYTPEWHALLHHKAIRYNMGKCGMAPDTNRHNSGGVGSFFQRQIIQESWKHRVLATAQRVWDIGMDKDVNETPWWVQRTELSRGWGLENGSLQLNLGREGFFGRQRVRQRGQTTQRMRNGLAGVSRS